MSYLYSFIAVSVAGAELTNEEASLLSNNHAICAVVLFTRNIINTVVYFIICKVNVAIIAP